MVRRPCRRTRRHGFQRRPFRPAAVRLPERSLPIAVAAIVAVASMLAVMPGPTTGAVGSMSGRGQDIRLAVNGGLGRPAEDLVDSPGFDAVDAIDAKARGDAMSFAPVIIPKDVETAARAEVSSTEAVDFLDDGTLLTGYAPETTVEDGADLVKRYKVKSGDTLVTIAREFDVSMMTLWWANKLKSKDDLHIGQVLRIPPVSGLVVTVKDTDTLESLAKRAPRSTPTRIVELNGLDDPTLVVGQVLVLPGAKGAPIPTPKPTPEAGGEVARERRWRRRDEDQHRAPERRRQLQRWPVPLAGRRRRQLHQPVLPRRPLALDIAGDYGSPVVAAAGGRVVVRRLEVQRRRLAGLDLARFRPVHHVQPHVGRRRSAAASRSGAASASGRLGSSGWATGPHLHFEVWRGGLPWSGGYQVNPHAVLLAPRPAPALRRSGPIAGPSRGRATITPMFLDDVRISVRAGAGGDGASTMRREAHVPRGGPDGGDGGRGGSVYLRVDAGQTTLHDFRFKHHFSATPGGRGERQKRHGKAGEDLYLAVPPGTAVIDVASGELIADLVAVGQEVMVARGGRGGLGNIHFATATHQAPKHAQKGEPGEERAAPRAPADRGHRPRRAAQRRQVHAARRAHRGDAQDRRLPVHHARAEPRA